MDGVEPTLAANQFPGSFLVTLVRVEARRFQVPMSPKPIQIDMLFGIMDD
jgi:hypothetical protein